MHNIINLLPAIIIILLYFVIAFIKPIIQPRIQFNICAICISVSSTWLALLIMFFADIPISTNSLGIFMGMSIIGTMYKMEKIYKNKKIKNFWLVRLIIVIGGYYSIIALLDKNWQVLFFSLLLSLFSIIIFSLLFQGITHEDVLKEQTAEGKDSSLIKKLDNCC